MSSTPQYGTGLNAADFAALDDMRADEERMRLRKNAAMKAAKKHRSPPLEQFRLMLGCFKNAPTQVEKNRYIERIDDAAVSVLRQILDTQTSCINKIAKISSICDQLSKVGIEKTKFFSTASAAILSLKKKRRQILKTRRPDTPVRHNGPCKA